MRKYLTIFGIALLAVLAVEFAKPAVAVAACSLKSWSQGATPRSSDLNSNFTCINNALKGSGFTLITGSDIASATVTRANLSPVQLFPVAVWATQTQCGSNGVCASIYASGISSVTRTAQGTYTVAISPARPDSTYWTAITTNDTTTACKSTSQTTSQFVMVCNTVGSTVADSTGITIQVFDDE